MSLIGKVYTSQDMRDAAKCLFACEVDLKHDNRDISRMLRQAADMMDRADGEAAAKREREATRDKSSQVGDAEKMREALQKIVLLTIKAGMSIRFDVACGIIAGTARCALRNCSGYKKEETK